MKSFIEHIQKSIYGPEYYQELLTRPASFSWKYYASFAMLLSLFLTIVSSIALVPLINQTLHNFPKNFLAYYPDELEVRIVNGHASSTVAEPYFLPIPKALEEGIGTSTRYLGVIDTQTPVSLERFSSFNALFSVSENAFIVRDERGSIRVSPFASNFNYTVNESLLRGLIVGAEPYFKFVAPLVILIVFIAMLFMFTLELFYLIFAALLIFIMGRLMKHKWTYGTAFRISLHAVTLPLLLSTAFTLVNLNIGTLPFFSTILLLVIVFVNTKNFPSEVLVVPDPAPSPLDEK